MTPRVSRATHGHVSRLASYGHETVDETVSGAIRALRQDAMGLDLSAELEGEERAWLAADGG